MRSIPLSERLPASDESEGFCPVFELLLSSSEVLRQANNERVKNGRIRINVRLAMFKTFTTQKEEDSYLQEISQNDYKDKIEIILGKSKGN
jgi:hypothetical protein